MGQAAQPRPRIGVLPSGLVLHSSLGRCGVAVFYASLGVSLAAVALGIAPTVLMITSREDTVQRAFGTVLFCGLSSALEQVDESESAVRSLTRTAPSRFPLDHGTILPIILPAIAVFRV